MHISLLELAYRELPTTVSLLFVIVGMFNIAKPLFTKYILARQTAFGWCMLVAGLSACLVFNTTGMLSKAAGCIATTAIFAAAMIWVYSLERAAQRRERNKELTTRP